MRATERGDWAGSPIGGVLDVGMFDWDEGDRFSFEDSDRFEEDSLCSWISEPESLCNNWRGWKKQNGNGGHHDNGKDGMLSLVELSAGVVASHIPFEVVERVCPPVPEQLQLRIAFWSFPESEEDIRLYSCLANGSADEFQRGEHLFRARAVRDLLQIGFHLSAAVISSQTLSVSKGVYNVAVTFDRGRITTCNCTCSSSASWCSHVVAVCLHRIHQPSQVRLRAPVSESLSRLHRDQLQKFAQYLISELPQQILPTAQRLLDELLSNQHTAINTVRGAPDPTAGASADSQTTWCLDESTLHENIRKILIKLCVPSPIVFSDVNYLSSTAPPAAAEWSSLLRPLRGREPEGMWNLLSIVREMFRRSDWNAIPLLAILTEEVLSCEQILVWWFNTKVSLHTGSGGQCGRSSVHANTHASQHACSSLCDEIVILWRLAALNPSLSAQDKQTFFNQLHEWHLKTVDKIWKLKTSGSGSPGGIRRCDIEIFQGFKPAMEACLLDWNDYPIFGVTYKDNSSRRWLSPYFHAKTGEHSNCEDSSHHHSRRGRPVEINSTMGKWCIPERRSLLLMHVAGNIPSVAGRHGESNRSSLSSEGFCENDAGDCIEIDRIVQCKGDAKQSQKVFANARANENYMQEESSGVEKEDVDSDESARQQPASLSGNGPIINRPNCEEKQEESSDEYQLYYYDPQAPLPPSNRSSDPRPEERFVVSVKKIEDQLEILFARAEALHAHGQTHEACKLAVQLAEQLLANPPDLMTEVPMPPARGKRSRRFNPAFHQMSLLASATMAKTAFLCSVLSENTQQHHLAFLVGLFGLELPRPPASTKALEVKLANQEQDIVLLLKKIPLGETELKIIRDRAEQLRDGTLRSRGDALLPLMLATYVFDALVLSGCNKVAQSNAAKAGDEVLGFDAAVSALGFKANVSEAEHPLLCEGTRRQRGDLAITLLVTYKDDQEKLAKIMDKLLDKEVHQMHKSPVLNPYYYTANGNQPSSSSTAEATNDPSANDGAQGIDEGIGGGTDGDPEPKGRDGDGGSSCKLDLPTGKLKMACHSDAATYGARIKEGHRHSHKCRTERSDAASSPSGWEEDYKAWEAKFRCTNFRTNKKHSAGMASIDSSAPETTSSDNSPTVVRRSNWIRCAGPGSDSGSSGESSDSFASSSSGDKALHNKIRDTISPPQSFITARFPPAVDPMARNTPCASKVTRVTVVLNRYKGKRVYPSIPNQPSEASAYFMFELAKTVLTKAGGNSNTAVLFTQPSSSQNHRGPHRGLHMCAFQIGLYALGLHNAVSPNWLSRTYSSHVSWITGQAMEIGSTAINFLIATWEGHLTPPEVASLADKASRGRDLAMVRAAAELTLSCLPHAHALNPNEVQRALIQCKEQSTEMLERACLAVESAAKGGGVYPEVLFDVAKRWHESYEESLQENGVRLHENRNDPDMAMHPVVAPCENNPLERNTLNIGPMEGSMAAPPPPPPIQIMPQLACTPISYALPYNHPYSYIQGLAPFLHPALPFHPAPPPPAYPYASLAAHTYYPATPVTTAQFRPPHGAGIYAGQVIGVAVSQGSVVQPRSVLAITTQAPTNLPIHQQPQVNGSLPQLSQRQLGYLLSAYRVGMLAMETLARRVHDDRPQAKYARSPPYGEDVKWLLGIAKKLGTSYLQEFCICTVNSVASPFVLHDIVLEAAHYLARSGTSPLAQPLRSHILTPLIQKCQQMFIACTHFKMYHITPAEYEEFVNIIRSARSAFQLTPGGIVQFNELLQSLRRSKSCKKELWQRIASAQAATAI